MGKALMLDAVFEWYVGLPRRAAQTRRQPEVAASA